MTLPKKQGILRAYRQDMEKSITDYHESQLGMDRIERLEQDSMTLHRLLGTLMYHVSSGTMTVSSSCITAYAAVDTLNGAE